MKPTMTRRILATTAAVLTAGGALIAGNTATANPNGEYVAFGDSFVANPGATDEANGTGRPGAVCPVSPPTSATTSPTSWTCSCTTTCNGTVAYVPTTPKTLAGYVETIQNGHVSGSTA